MTKLSSTLSSPALRRTLMAVALASAPMIGFAAELPNIKILATGGTIAGVSASSTQTNYASAKVGVDLLIEAVPEMKKVARVSGEQVAKIGSQDMNDEVWLKLAKRVNELLAQKDVDGVVITHGTDTMEETAYFLNLTIKSDKPVVLVGAMRPSNAMSADGPANLFNAVVVAASKESKGRGVVVAMNELVLDGRDVIKTNTTGVQTFAGANFGPLAQIHNGKVFYQRAPGTLHTTKTEFDVSKLKALPKVGIIYNYANASELPAKAMVDANFDGIVSAGVGNGNLYVKNFEQMEAARKKNIAVVRSSRVPTGSTTLDAEVEDTKYGFVAAGTLNPQKARVLLQLALTKTKDPKAIQAMFERY